jgi:AmmeMemoRadiSam system protein B
MTHVRPAAVAGSFYPEHPDVLTNELEQLFQGAHSHELEGELVGLIVPHAGYQYSGQTAAEGYKLIHRDEFPAVVIVAPSHREYFRGISVYPGVAYRTPLGDVPVDADLRTALVAIAPEIRISDVGHGGEHAVEVQLPFLQRTLGRFMLLPVVMGDQSPALCHVLAQALANVLEGKKALLLASSDLSHYHPSEIARRLDSMVIGSVGAFDSDALLRDLEHRAVEACGGGPMVAVMEAAKRLGANRAHILAHCNSGDVTGNHDAVVGYLSAAFTRTN